MYPDIEARSPKRVRALEIPAGVMGTTKHPTLVWIFITTHRVNFAEDASKFFENSKETELLMQLLVPFDGRVSANAWTIEIVLKGVASSASKALDTAAALVTLSICSYGIIVRTVCSISKPIQRQRVPNTLE